MRKIHFKNLLAFLVVAFVFPVQSFSQDWKEIVTQRLPEYGHRNWIVIADAAYPKQSALGIETICTDAKQMKVLEYVLKAVDAADHVRPIIMFHAELESVSDQSAPGVQEYRTDLKKLLGERAFKEMPHDDIIRKLDESSDLFNVLLLKTDMTIPYTSVFIELDCGYWSAEKENELRDFIKQKNIQK